MASSSMEATSSETTGPAIGTPYNPALVGYRQVGLATLEFGDDAHALLHYTADGVLVVKQITRLTFAAQSASSEALSAGPATSRSIARIQRATTW